MALAIPYQQTDDRQLNQFQQALRSALAPFTSTPMSSPTLITQVNLVAGIPNLVPLGLNKKLSGWYPVRVRAQANIWDGQDSNTTPESTLILYTSANVVVDIVVF